MSAVDFAAVKAVKLSAVVGHSVKLRRSGQEWIGCCPFHDDRTPSFSINDGKGFAYCFGCGWNGDAADFVASLAGCGVREAAERIVAGNLPVMSRHIERSSARCETADAARRIWREAWPVYGTVAEVYLRHRRIHIALPGTLRFARLRHPSGGQHPCLVALVTSGKGVFAGIQRTYLTDDGRKVSGSAKLSLGSVKGAAIRLTPVAAEIVVCEGAEDGLTLLQDRGKAVWVSAGASMLPAMTFPPMVASVIIAADNDFGGEREAQKARAAFVSCGLKARIVRPAADFKDFNEQLMASGETGKDGA